MLISILTPELLGEMCHAALLEATRLPGRERKAERDPLQTGSCPKSRSHNVVLLLRKVSMRVYARALT